MVCYEADLMLSCDPMLYHLLLLALINTTFNVKYVQIVWNILMEHYAKLISAGMCQGQALQVSYIKLLWGLFFFNFFSKAWLEVMKSLKKYVSSLVFFIS